MPVATRGSIRITVGGRFKPRRQRTLIVAVERALLKAGKQYLKKVQQLTPVFSGQLRNSYQIQFIGGAQVGPTKGVVVTSPLQYAKIMEFGRRPGSRWPPTGPIRQWVIRKAGAAVQKFGVNGATFVIRRAIGVKGIKVTRKGGLKHNPGKGAMFRRAVDQLGRQFVPNLIAAALKRAEAKVK